MVGEPDWPAILRAAGFVQAEMWAGHIAGPARRWEITAGKRAAAFAATNGHESGGGETLTESLNYRYDRLVPLFNGRTVRITPAEAQQFGRVENNGRVVRAADQQAIANIVYGGEWGRLNLGNTQPGDGWRFRGRGLTQITGRDAYARAGEATGLPLLQQPDLAVQPNVAASVACWVWAGWKGCNRLADAGNVEGWRRAINGGVNGLEDVRQRYEAALRVAG
jgi:putative chitinase